MNDNFLLGIQNTQGTAGPEFTLYFWEGKAIKAAYLLDCLQGGLDSERCSSPLLHSSPRTERTTLILSTLSITFRSEIFAV